MKQLCGLVEIGLKEEMKEAANRGGLTSPFPGANILPSPPPQASKVSHARQQYAALRVAF
jgi:hypothetical protein